MIIPDIHHIHKKEENGSVVGMCYRLKKLEKILPMLDFREKNGYTRTATQVYSLDGTKQFGKAIVYFSQGLLFYFFDVCFFFSFLSSFLFFESNKNILSLKT